jgi:hypothetical protein
MNIQVYDSNGNPSLPSDNACYYWMHDIVDLTSDPKITILNKEFTPGEQMTNEDFNTIMSLGTTIPTYMFYSGGPLGCYLPRSLDHPQLLVIPSNIEYIHLGAFGDLGFGRVIFNEGLKEIGDSAFDHMSEQRDIIIPSTVTYIGSSAFGSSLSIAVEIRGENTTIGALAFNEYDLAMLIVPKNTKKIYKDKPNWSSYADVMVEKGDVLSFTIGD